MRRSAANKTSSTETKSAISDIALSRLYLRELTDRDESGLEFLANKSFAFNYQALFDLLSEPLRKPPDSADMASIFTLTFGLPQIRTPRDTHWRQAA